MQYDCFNGDADGICALTQLRLAEPLQAELITGVKRDINLLSRVPVESAKRVTALDISLDKNRDALDKLLAGGATVFYCDHHYAGEIPENKSLTSLINTSANVCTSLLINQHLNGAYTAWAVTGTFGDNLQKSAQGLAKSLDLTEAQLDQLQKLGIYLNYNGYGASLDDLYFKPDQLFQRTVQFASPFDFIQQDRETFATLQEGYHQDMAKAKVLKASYLKDNVVVYQLPNKAWARRVSGVFGNQLANQSPAKAHAVMTELASGDFMVSLRAPLDNKQGAEQVCQQFATGGGRAAAAGINRLPSDEIERFYQALNQYYSSEH